MKIGNNNYKLIFLDSNALREITNNTFLSGKGFLEKFMNSMYIPCFSIYNVMELKPNKEGFQKFIDFFSIIPCFMFYPAKIILQEEYNHYLKNEPLIISNQIANAFTPFNTNDSYNFSKWITTILSTEPLAGIIQNEINELPYVSNSWEAQRIELEKNLKQLKLPLNMVDEKYYSFQENEMIAKDIKVWGFKPVIPLNISQLPAFRIMGYSQFNRIHLTKKPIKSNDVMDVTISCIIPYVDAVITENFQTDVYKKAKRLIPQLKNLETYTLKDIRLSPK
nr:hypothetical protein [uncultured Anaerocolumna sp.]